MLKDIIVIDNALKDPYKLIDFSKNQLFYKKSDHPTDAIKNINWRGERTDYYNSVEKGYLDEVVDEIMSKMFFEYQPHYLNCDCSFNWKYFCFFHKINKFLIENENWKHKDDHCYACLLYLNPDSEFNHGTKIYKNNQQIEIGNVFNRLIMYRSDYYHHVNNGGFGENETTRLTFSIFFDELNINIKHRK